MTVAERDLDRLVQDIESQWPSTWAVWPGGWPGEVEVALIDAVLSIRSRYGRPATEVRPATGVHRRVSLYRDHRSAGSLDDLTVLAALNPEELAGVLDTRQRTGGR